MTGRNSIERVLLYRLMRRGEHDQAAVGLDEQNALLLLEPRSDNVAGLHEQAETLGGAH